MGSHDPAERRRGVRKGRERGCWVYIPAELLREAELDPETPTIYYRTWAPSRRSVIVKLYPER